MNVRKILLASCAALAASCATRDAAPSASDAVRALSSRAIVFGHQSVGYNIVQGVSAIVAATPGATLQVLETRDPAEVGAGVFAHYANGTNGDPAGKIAAFEAAIAGGLGAAADVAFFKFCYVDFGGGTDVAAVFSAYQAAFARLRSAYPDVRFVHVTVPLVTGADGANVVREQFSALVRDAYAGREPVFDLAKVESTRPDGFAEAFDGVPALVPSYSSDGGHLNAAGQDVVARALVSFLAALP